MSIVYKGYAPAYLHLQPGARWSKTPEGLDVYEATHGGPKNAKARFLRSYPLEGNTKMPGNSAMYLVDISDDDSRAYSFVQLRYVGLRSRSRTQAAPRDFGQLLNGEPHPRIDSARAGGRKMPLEHTSRRTSIKNATNSTQTPVPATREITYISPEVVIAYATDKENLEAQFGDSFATPDYALRIIRDVIETEEGKIYRGSAPAGLVSALSFSPVWQVTQLDSSEVKYTPYWTNQEVWAYEYPQAT